MAWWIVVGGCTWRGPVPDEESTGVPGPDDPAEQPPDGTPGPGSAEEGAPDLVVSPTRYTFPDGTVPCAQTVDVELRNDGDAPLTLTSLDYTSGGLLSLDERGLQLPLELAPGESRTVGVTLAGAAPGEDAGALAIGSDDPDGTVTAEQSGVVRYAEPVTESFTAPEPQVDLLLLIDHSCSMEAEHFASVEAAMPLLVSTLDTTADWQIAQVTLEDGCANGGVLDGSVAGVDQFLVDHAFDKLPFEPSYLTEKLLQLAALALSLTDAGECNEGFLRPGALLHVAVVSDEPEQSGRPAADWVTDLQVYDPGVKVSGVLDLQSCSQGSGGYVEAVSLTGGVQLDICSPNWGNNVDRIGEIHEDIDPVFALAEPPIEDTLEVTVNGAPATFTFDALANEVQALDPLPATGEEVEVSYSVLADCGG